MYHSDSAVITAKAMSTRSVTKEPLYHSTFSGTGAASCVHGKMWCLPSRTLMRSRTNATGRKATYPSSKRMRGRDQRAVVMRCTATNITPAEDSEVTYSQLT